MCKEIESLGCHFSLGRNPLATGCKHVHTQREKVLWNKQNLFSVKESVVSIWARKYLFLALVLFI
jgi:hypothetical protein